VGIQSYFGKSSHQQSHSSFNVNTKEALQKMKVDLPEQLREEMRQEREQIKQER